jgi:predicted dehydrogenase
MHRQQRENGILNFIKPDLYHRLTVQSDAGKRVEHLPGGSTYQAQLEAFVAAIRDGKIILTTTGDAVANMRVIDAIYDKAGLPPHGR